MKNLLYYVFAMEVLMLLSFHVSAQTIQGSSDSVAFITDREDINRVTFSDGRPVEIIMQVNGVSPVEFKTNPIFRDLGAGASTLLTRYPNYDRGRNMLKLFEILKCWTYKTINRIQKRVMHRS